MMKIRPIEKDPSVAEKIIERIIHMISDGTFQPGDKLPSEKDLAKAFQVSRPSLREALTILQTRDLIEIRPRSGTYIRNAMPSQFREPLEQLLDFEPNKMWELLEMRKYMDSAAAELAALRRTEEDIAEFRNLLHEVTQSIQKRGNASVEIERAYGVFFKHLSKCSYNTLFSHFNESMSDLFRRALPFSRMKLEHIPKSKETIIEQLFTIVEAIARQDSELARLLVTKHIEYVENSLRRVIGNRTNGYPYRKFQNL